MSFYNPKTKQLVNSVLVSIPQTFLATEDEYIALRQSVERASLNNPSLIPKIKLLIAPDRLLSYAWFCIWEAQQAWPRPDVTQALALGFGQMIKAIYGEIYLDEHERLEADDPGYLDLINQALGKDYAWVLYRIYHRGAAFYIDRVNAAMLTTKEKYPNLVPSALSVERVNDNYLKILIYVESGDGTHLPQMV